MQVRLLALRSSNLALVYAFISKHKNPAIGKKIEVRPTTLAGSKTARDRENRAGKMTFTLTYDRVGGSLPSPPPTSSV